VTCKAAAFALGYFDRMVSTYHGPDRPEGCYVKDGQLWMSDRMSKGNGAMHGAEPICGSKAYPTTTTTTRTTTTTTTLVTTTTILEPTTTTTTTTTTWGYPSFFCVTLVRADSHELEILKKQLFRRTGIFACEEYAIYSDHTNPQVVGVGPDGSDVRTIVIPPLKKKVVNNFAGGFPCIETKAMLKVWDLVHKDGRYKRHNWILKIDPSSVFLLDRLKSHVKKHSSDHTGLFLTTCQQYNLVLPSLEVFSVRAMDIFFGRNRWQCGAEQQKQVPCEESFMTQCMDALGLKRINGFQLAGDPRCEAAPCTDDSRVLFRHDFQDAASWFECFNEAIH